jgi:hypothetical protein
LLRALPYQFKPPAARTKALWVHPEVDVSVAPDLLVSARSPVVSGALRFYVAKDQAYELGAAGAEIVATLLHFWQRDKERKHTLAQRCLVLEFFQQRLTAAPSDVATLEAVIRRGCADYARFWRALEADAAA